MKTNVGSTDTTIRWALAIVFFAVAILFNAIPFVALVAALLALLMAGTALTKVCPLYTLLGLDTTRPAKPGSQQENPAH